MTEEEIQLAQEFHDHEVGNDAAALSDAAWEAWLTRCERAYFGRAIPSGTVNGVYEAGFDDEGKGYSLDGMFDLWAAGKTPLEAVMSLPRGVMITNETVIPGLGPDGVAYQFHLFDSIPFLEREPWMRQIRSKLLVFGKEAKAKPVAKRVAKVMKSNTVELANIILASGDEEVIRLARAAGLIP